MYEAFDLKRCGTGMLNITLLGGCADSWLVVTIEVYGVMYLGIGIGIPI